ncbi:collagen-binding domain-containing protein [Flavobacterium antarcticum]|uniref:collagen-binding domain-containing protein n=1 Tax=Flavobacterium antarcticum TaxID=271155 RepID=UPI0003B33F02|nr:collagen-binding domain-containing protein [Flavobacterium antarcticum]
MLSKLLKIRSISTLVLTFAGTLLFAQSPTAPAKNFNVFTLGNTTLINNESEGPIAIGGDLTIAGSYQVAAHSPGTFSVNNVKIGLLVNGKVNYQSGNAVQVLSNGYVKIGNANGSTVWYADQNNATPPIRITPNSNYNSSPRIELNSNAPSLGVSVNNNPVFQANLLDFNAAFQTMKASSLSISQCTQNIQLTNPNGQSITNTTLTNQVKINLQDGTNIWNLTGAQLNSVDEISFNNVKPSASKVLVINVDASGTFNWDVWNQGGIGFQDCLYIMYNFYNTTTLNINNGAAVEGTIFAPFADIFKGLGNQSNIEGQVIANSFRHSGGEVHYAIFSPSVTGCAVPPVVGVKPTSDFDVNSANQCLNSNSFVFTNTSNTGSYMDVTDPISYLWKFGDGTTSADMNPTKVYSAPGTYIVKLKASNSYGWKVATQTMTVYGTTLSTVNQSTVSQATNSVTKQFVLTNSLDFTSYSWAVSNGASGLFANQGTVNFTFTHAGYYEVKLTTTDVNGCQYTSTIPVNIASSEVNTGNGGGLESESLGDQLSKQYVSRKMKSIPTEFVKSAATRFDKVKLVSVDNFSRGGTSDLTMTEMFPTNLQSGDVADITSPTDILDYTIAQEVLSVDFSVAGSTKAVVLGVRTKDKVYNHTKASCDRLRGAEILNVKTVQVGGYNFLMQAIQQRNGVTEYAISFAVGKNHGDSFYTLQTNWFVKEYAVAKDVYNFQVWATLPEQTTKLVNDILNNLQASKPLLQTEIQKMPKTYASKISREGSDLVLKLKSVKEEQSIEISMDQNYSETNGFTHRYNPLKSEISQTIRLNVDDSYEFDGLIYVEGDVQDAFYHADGNWGLDYDPTYTLINKYTVSNNFEREYKEGELAINRNVNLEVHSEDDYATLYKSLLPGQIPADYNEYQFVSFKAKGSGLLELGLVKSSVENWKHQYRAMINVGQEEKTYYIPFKFFTSSKSTQTINADDLTMLTFTFLPVEAKTKDLNLTIEDVKFTKTAPDGYEELLYTMKNEFMIYPNPSRGNVNCMLYSETTTTATATLYDVSGKVIYATEVKLKEGKNEMDFNFNVPTGVLFFSIKSDKVNYGTSKIFFK